MISNFKLILGGAFVLSFIASIFLSFQEGKKVAKNDCLLQKNIETIKIKEKIIYVKQNQEKIVKKVNSFDTTNRRKFMQSIWQERANIN